MIRSLLIFGILISVGQAFSQSLQTNDLIGVWHCDKDKNYIFQKDSILIIEKNSKDELYEYTLSQIQGNSVLSIRSKKSPDSLYKELFKARNNKNQIRLTSYKNLHFDLKTNSWLDGYVSGGNEMFVIIELKRN